MIELYSKTIALHDIVAAIVEPAWLFKQPDIPEEVLEENRKLQYVHGLDEADDYAVTFAGWTVRFKPDAVTNDGVVEFKVKRRFSNTERLFRYATIQAALAAYFLGKKKITVVLYNYEDKTILFEVDIWLSEIDMDALLSAVRDFLTLLENIASLKNVATLDSLVAQIPR